jgi:urease accessory protein
MAWHAQLSLNYRSSNGKTLLEHSHSGPLRVLQSLYPEGGSICHNILVHPPGGVAAGDDLDIKAKLGAGTHALITTPGATRFYKSLGEAALARTQFDLAENARLEWFPQENIAYSGCIAENRLQLRLATSATMMGWDITALGLPAAGQAFERGIFTQHVELMGEPSSHSLWLERGQMAAEDLGLLRSPLGLNGHSCLGALFFIAGCAINTQAKELFLSKSREISAASSLAATCGITSPHSQVIVLRVLADQTEPVLELCKQVRSAWREIAWGLQGKQPRIWAM